MDISAEKQELDVVRYCVQQQLSCRELLTDKNITLSTYIEPYSRALVMRLEASVFASRPIRLSEQVKYPKTWWDAFMARFAQCWWLRVFRRWLGPVQYEVVTVDFEGRLVFPDITPRFREEHRTFLVGGVMSVADWRRQ